MLYVVLLVLILLFLVGMPGIGYQHNYGYYPSGGLGLVVVILVVLLLMGRL